MAEKLLHIDSLNAADLKSFDSNLSTLLALALQILKSKGDYMIVIEEYAQLLSQVEPQIGLAIKNPPIRAKLQQLEQLHADVMARVQTDKDGIKLQIAALKRKEKVAITYTDQLPKRISLGTRRKI